MCEKCNLDGTSADPFTKPCRKSSLCLFRGSGQRQRGKETMGAKDYRKNVTVVGVSIYFRLDADGAASPPLLFLLLCCGSFH